MKLLLLTSLLLLLGSGCAAPRPHGPVFDSRVVLFVSPDEREVAALKRALGEDDFYVAADDENWYRSLAFALLDSLGVESRVVAGRRFAFLVDGAPRTYDWSDQPSPWFVVLYDGARAPRVTHSVDLPADVAFLIE